MPLAKINQVSGSAVYVPGDDIDTDRIIPARFMKCVTFDGLGEYLFHDVRYDEQGQEKIHSLNDNRFGGSSIMLSGKNFGCGSSREHAPQSLYRAGFRAIIAGNFAEIFFGNCLALGIPCLTASKEEIVNLQNLVDKNNNQIWDFNLKNLSISNQKETFKLILDEGPHNMLYSGKWDATSQLLDEEEKINKTFNNLPYLNNFKQQI